MICLGPNTSTFEFYSDLFAQQGCLLYTSSVFIYADDQDCVARVMQRNQLNEHEAAKRIKHVDRMRKKYFACYAAVSYTHLLPRVVKEVMTRLFIFTAAE